MEVDPTPGANVSSSDADGYAVLYHRCFARDWRYGHLVSVGNGFENIQRAGGRTDNLHNLGSALLQQRGNIIDRVDVKTTFHARELLECILPHPIKVKGHLTPYGFGIHPEHIHFEPLTREGFVPL